jgi:hypothetical protein
VFTLAIVGFIAFPKGGGAGTPAATRTPAPTTAPTPRPSPIALPLDPQLLAVTTPGSYLAGDPFLVPLTMTLPAGWAGKVGGPYAAFLERAVSGTANANIELSLSQTIYAEPCHDRGFLAPQPGPTVDDLASALARLPGFDATTPTEVSVDGYSGKQLTLTAPARFDGCTLASGGYRLWQLPLGWVFSFTPGQLTTIRIVDVNGKRLVVSSATFPTTSAQELVEVREILDSIRIERHN